MGKFVRTAQLKKKRLRNRENNEEKAAKKKKGPEKLDQEVLSESDCDKEAGKFVRSLPQSVIEEEMHNEELSEMNDADEKVIENLETGASVKFNPLCLL